MKTIYSIIGVICVAFLMFFGVSLIGQQALINGNLDEQSINALAQYDSQVAAFENNLTLVMTQNDDLVDYEPDANLLDEFIKEYSEQKDKVNQLKSAVKLLYKLPDIIVMSIPFVDEVDLGIYRDIIWFLLGVTLFVAIFNAIANRRISKT